MAIEIVKDSKFVKLLAEQAKGARVQSNDAEDAAKIISEQTNDLSPANRHQIAQTIAYTLTEQQSGTVDFMERFADVKTIGENDRASFDIKTRGIKAYWQAKGATTARSYVSGRRVTLETETISARPAINVVDLRTGRVNMADLIREANEQMTNMKLAKVETVLHDAIDDYGSPFYGTGTGIVKATLDSQLNYFRRLGPVTILGDQAAVQQLAGITGMVSYAGQTMIVNPSEKMIDEANNNGYIGKYVGCDVVVMNNAYLPGSITPALDPDWLYIIPSGLSADSKNLKIVTEGPVSAFESQNIDDLVFEVRLDQGFGAGFVSGGKNPTIGAYKIV